MIIVEKRRVSSASEIPQILGEFKEPQNIETAYTKGFYSIPDSEDEIIIVNAFMDPRQKINLGVIEPGIFNLEVGDRLIITEGAAIYLKANGTIRIDASNGLNLECNGIINLTAPTINLNGNVNISGDLNIDGDGFIQGSQIATV